MRFGEPLTDFRTTISTDDRQVIDVDFNAAGSLWRLTDHKGVSRSRCARQCVDCTNSAGGEAYLDDG